MSSMVEGGFEDGDGDDGSIGANSNAADADLEDYFDYDEEGKRIEGIVTVLYCSVL